MRISLPKYSLRKVPSPYTLIRAVLNSINTHIVGSSASLNVRQIDSLLGDTMECNILHLRLYPQ